VHSLLVQLYLFYCDTSTEPTPNPVSPTAFDFTQLRAPARCVVAYPFALQIISVLLWRDSARPAHWIIKRRGEEESTWTIASLPAQDAKNGLQVVYPSQTEHHCAAPRPRLRAGHYDRFPDFARAGVIGHTQEQRGWHRRLVIQHRHGVVRRQIKYGSLSLAHTSSGTAELLLAGPAAQLLDHRYAGDWRDINRRLRELPDRSADAEITSTLVSLCHSRYLKGVGDED
jgi:hypothetical protein